MKGFLKGIAAAVFIGLIGVSVAKADTTTSRWGLTKPDVGSANWGPKINTNYDLIDNAAGLALANTFTNTNTFNSGTTFNGLILAGTGTVSAPSITHSGGTTKGIFFETNVVAFAVNSSTVMFINTSGMTVQPGYTLSASHTGSFTGALSNVSLPDTLGSAPSLHGLTQTTKGIYFASNEIGFVINGSTYAKINSSGLMQVNGNMYGVDLILGGATPTGTHQAGSLKIFPGTASKGNWLFTAVDNTNNDQMTITNAAQSGAWTYTIPNFGQSGKFAVSTSTGPRYVLQQIQCTVTTSSSTSATTFVETGHSCVMTPTQTTSKVRISYSGTLASNSGTAGNTVCVTLARGGSNLLGTSGGAVVESMTAGTAVGIMPASIVYLDSPASTSAQTYSTQFKKLAGTTTATYGQSNQTSIILLEEIGQ